jgi:hypothetical protein
VDAQDGGKLRSRGRVGRAGQEAVDGRAVGAPGLEALDAAEPKRLDEVVVDVGEPPQPARAVGGRDLVGMVGLALEDGDLAVRAEVEGADVPLAGDHALDGAAGGRDPRDVAVPAVLQQEVDLLAVGGIARRGDVAVQRPGVRSTASPATGTTARWPGAYHVLGTPPET